MATMTYHSGIYQILNKTNGKQYIGSAINIKKRWSQHQSLLRKNKHHSPHLQHAWNKHGEENFVFEIILDVEDKNNLIAWEQIWMNALQPEYNVLLTAGSPLGAKRSDDTKARMSAAKKGKVLSDEHKAKMSASHKGRVFSDEAKAKMSAAKKGKVFSDEHKARMRISSKRQRVKATRDDGLIIYFDSIMDAHRSGFESGSIRRAIQKSRKHKNFKWEKI